MIKNLDVEIKQPRLDLTDGLVYSHVKAPLTGTELDLKMMIMRESPIGRPFGEKPPVKPCILWVMGGGWRECPREKCIPFLVDFALNGYIVAAIQYRVTSEAIWPAQITDVMTAVRYLRTNADKFGIDTDHIAVMGLSAGGHLTAMAAMNPTKYATEEWNGYSSEIQAAVDMFGPADLSVIEKQKKESTVPMPAIKRSEPSVSAEELLVGGKMSEHLDVAYDANPINHISEKTCPLLILHGDADALVPLEQSVMLHDAMNAAGHDTDLYVLKGAVHGGHEFFQTQVKGIIFDFLDKHLKNA